MLAGLIGVRKVRSMRKYTCAPH